MIIQRYLNSLKHMTPSRDILGLRLTTTWKCDSKCITCSIWQDPDAGKNDLTPDEIDKLTRSKYFRKTEYVTLSGGEPTLRKDLPEIVSIIHRNIPTATFGITTHGMHPDLEEQVFRKILQENPSIKFRLVAISLNGPKEIHDKTRGMEGAWEKAIESYERLKDIIPCEFSFTFCKDNVGYFNWVQDFAEKKGTKAYICWTVMNDRFKVSDKDLLFWEEGMDKVLREHVERYSFLPKGIGGILLNLLLLPSAITKSCLYDSIVNRDIMPCYAGKHIVHIDPIGDVYPCNFKLSQDRILGNIREKDFDEIWGPSPNKILQEIKCGECMYPNGLCGDSDIYPSICNSPLYTLKWYLKKLVTEKPLVEIRKT